MKKVIKIRNLDCAACALELQEELQEIKGVEEAQVDFMTQRVSLTLADDTAKESEEKARYAISHFEEVEIVEAGAPEKKERHVKEIVSLAIAIAFFIPALVISFFENINEWVSFGLYLASFAAAGWSVVWTVITNIPKIFKGGFHLGILLDENLLMTIAAAGAFALKESMEGAIVMILYEIGELLQSIAVGSSRGAITKLASLKSDGAILLKDGKEEEVLPEDLKAGDTILLRKGDKVSADCKLLSEYAEIDAKSMTGEAYLQEKHKGDELLSGCVNAGAAVTAEVLRPEHESAAAKILELVENSTSKKAKPEKFITKFARIYTPVVVLIAILIAVVPPLFDGYSFSKWIMTALNILVISCPCALIISVPLTYFSGVGTLARLGVLTKGAVYLDILAGVKCAAFDKTGTLTEGKFTVAKVNGDERALYLAAAAEKCSSHPLAQAFKDVEAARAESCEEIAGRGLKAVIDGKQVLVGSLRLMQEEGIEFTEAETSRLVVYVAEEGKFVGSIEIDDCVREDAKDALLELKKAGVNEIAVFTGDTRARAEESLKGLPLDTIVSDLLPAEKAEEAEKLSKKGKLLYVGDGINDTPVMKASDVSAAMGALGSDAAIEASDFVLASDKLSALPKAVKGAKKTRRIVVQNIVFSIVVKVALMVLSVLGFVPLWAAVLGDTGVMLLAVLNSMRMRAKLK
ncbi:MAG: cadmium-translocating P-type ATPase [Clostridia bacterium]|nr:cadmium-translocating P-type ATPase [Clostridia bacterium]